MSSSSHPFFAQLPQLLIAYTNAFDTELARRLETNGKHAAPSLAMWANVLRFVSDDGVRASDLPALSGIAKPTIKSMVQCLERHGWIEVDKRGTVRFTAVGKAARLQWPAAREAVDSQWKERLGGEKFNALSAMLHEASDLFAVGLPQYPMPAAHRGARPSGE